MTDRPHAPPRPLAMGSTRAAALLRALRVHQWTKNLLAFVPVVLDHRVFDGPVLLRGGLAFAAFCLAASAGYLLNDVLDAEADRAHRTKRHRPVASGALSPRTAASASAALTVAAAAVALQLPPSFGATLALYVVLAVAYSVALKRVPVLDVLLLAGFYTLRVLAGVAATQVRFSPWLVAFSLFLFLSLAFLKRFAEVRQLPSDADRVARRGYVGGDLPWLQSLGSASGYLSVLVLALYITAEDVRMLYRHPALLWLLAPVLLYWISRMWLLAHRRQMHDDPIVASLRDPQSYVLGALACAVLLAAAR